MNKPVAWLVKDCPNFHITPTDFYDRVFRNYSDDGRKMSPEYWRARGFKVYELYECEDVDAEFWLLSNGSVSYNRESAESAISLGLGVTPVCTIKYDAG